MTIRIIAVIAMGDMGHAVGHALRQNGYDVVTCLTGRSDTSRWMANRAEVLDIADMNTLVDKADLFLSILPPIAALALAQDVAKSIKITGQSITYVDCNAISPATVQKIAEVMHTAGVPFIDAGIIGSPPGKDVPRFYVSGQDTSAIEQLNGCGFSVKNCGEFPGKASAIKMCYAALTKGTFTLHTALLMAAKSLGVYETLIKEFQYSQNTSLEKMKSQVPFIPADAERWIGEMEEISATFRGTGVTGGFHDGAADVLKILTKTAFANETRETLDRSRSLDDAINEFVKHIK